MYLQTRPEEPQRQPLPSVLAAGPHRRELGAQGQTGTLSRQGEQDNDYPSYAHPQSWM